MLAFRGSFKEITVFYVLSLLLSAYIAFPYIISGGEVTEEGKKVETAGQVFLMILVATGMFLLLVFFAPWFLRYVITLLEIFFLFGTSALLLYSLPFYVSPLLPLLIVIIRVVFGKYEIVQNISTTIIVGVSAGVVGATFSPIVTLVLLLILVIYDYISVFVTKHMVILAKALGGGEGTKSDKHLLGAGDIAIPAIFAVSLARVSLLSSILAMIGAVLGLLFTIHLAQRWKRVLPALPSISLPMLALSLLGLLIG